uniref:AlNc14C96G5853 protein n=1 Tax=Albugo laibachii Nc14 TaxID=890382 RepID=F0WGX7_9STRA|nr:AlNc14C96G5853 [Albugo laibachii Nc14]|eukprot:CCA20492.1 AlNc14C96G5853 [Albugo laibachii Nc14]
MFRGIAEKIARKRQTTGIRSDTVINCRNLLQTTFAGGNVVIEKKSEGVFHPVECIYYLNVDLSSFIKDESVITHVIDSSPKGHTHTCIGVGCFGTNQCVVTNASNPTCQEAYGYNLNLEFGGNLIDQLRSTDVSTCRHGCLNNHNCTVFTHYPFQHMCLLYSSVNYVRTLDGATSRTMIL